MLHKVYFLRFFEKQEKEITKVLIKVGGSEKIFMSFNLLESLLSFTSGNYFMSQIEHCRVPHQITQPSVDKTSKIAEGKKITFVIISRKT